MLNGNGNVRERTCNLKIARVSKREREIESTSHPILAKIRHGQHLWLMLYLFSISLCDISDYLLDTIVFELCPLR